MSQKYAIKSAFGENCIRLRSWSKKIPLATVTWPQGNVDIKTRSKLREYWKNMEEYEEEFGGFVQYDGPVAYNYEPIRRERGQSQTPGPVMGRINGHRREMEMWSIENQWRVEQVSWCLCTQCESMTSALESVCCREIEEYRALLEKLPEDITRDITCLTRRPGFQGVCLDPYVLAVAYLAFKQEHGPLQTTKPEQYRYTAYRQIVRWAYGTLGRQIRKPIPACVVAAIRRHYPEEGGTYKGFEWADHGEDSFSFK
ncbi:uncharacterized protein LOC134467125 isoform X1 [Engraulis encrasicolus]|uniref:uncharacterized protein LOC134467125 isoform X1 n=1 Tax=Engraulis encrasicolus TaxID=184585 RepID=UPI002FD01449